MTMGCNYPDREAVVVSYLYDDIDPIERVAFETHVNTCLVCRSELAELQGVRSTLAQWATPEGGRNTHQPVSGLRPRAWWHDVPVWAQVAAAMVVLGVSASVANLDIRYDHNGWNVRTGWSKPAPASAPPVAAQGSDAPWRAEIAELRSQLRSEMRAQPAAASTASSGAMSDAEFQRRVRVLLDESEKNQQKELALRLTQLQIDINAERQADLRRINQNFRDVTSTYGGQLLKQQQQINYLLPVSQR